MGLFGRKKKTSTPEPQPISLDQRRNFVELLEYQRLRERKTGKIYVVTDQPMPRGKATDLSKMTTLEVKNWRASEVVSAYRTLAAPDSCDYCRNAEQYIFPISVRHPLPHAHCTHRLGCRCTVIPYDDVSDNGFDGIDKEL
jgi:hypothetical protein